MYKKSAVLCKVQQCKGKACCLIFLGGRFASRSSLDQLSVWLRPHAKVYDRFGQLQRDLTQFFKSTELKVSHVCVYSCVMS